MAAVTICRDFGAQWNKICHSFHFFTFYFPWSDGIGWHDLCFLMLNFKPAFSSPLLPSSRGSSIPFYFHPLEWYRVHIWGYWYFSWQSWFQLVIHPVHCKTLFMKEAKDWFTFRQTFLLSLVHILATLNSIANTILFPWNASPSSISKIYLLFKAPFKRYHPQEVFSILLHCHWCALLRYLNHVFLLAFCMYIFWVSLVAQW